MAERSPHRIEEKEMCDSEQDRVRQLDDVSREKEGFRLKVFLPANSLRRRIRREPLLEDGQQRPSCAMPI